MKRQVGQIGSIALGAFALAMFVGLCLVFGAHNQNKTYAKIAERKLEALPPLNYGQAAPDIDIAFTEGRRAKLSSYAGRWVLLVFADPDCDSCFHELDSLAKISPNLSGVLDIVPIMEVHPVLAPKTLVAKTLVDQHHYPFSIAVDDTKEERLFGCAQDYPYAVLIDPQGKCRLTVQGFVPTPHKSQLACAIKSYFHGDFYNCLPLTRWSQYTVSPDVTFSIDGQQTTLASLSQDKVVMVTFFTGNEPFEDERAKVIQRYTAASNMLFLCIGEKPGALPQNLNGPNVVKIDNPSQSLIKEFSQYQPERGPVSILVYHLSRFAAERGVEGDPTAFEQSIAYSVYLSDSQFLPQGFPVP